MEEYSCVDYVGLPGGYSCGYCKSSSTNYSHGMHTYLLKVEDYQRLIDRGWRRSGTFCYKPEMQMTCCPAYTIKCDALDFKISKSQKKILKRMHNFLANGTRKKSSEDVGKNDMEESTGVCELYPECAKKLPKSLEDVMPTENDLTDDIKESPVATNKLPSPSKRLSNQPQQLGDAPGTSRDCPESSKVDQEQSPNPSNAKKRKLVFKGSGADPNKPICRKAKLKRQERREAKLATNGCDTREQKASNNNQSKSLEDLLNEPMPSNPAHTLEIRLVRSSRPSESFKESWSASYSVYSNYQMVIHNDKPSRCNSKQFKRFLCTSPLKLRLVKDHKNTLAESYRLFKSYQMTIHGDDDEDASYLTFLGFLVESPLSESSPASGPSCGYGSFHQQYWLDGTELIGVAVIDILPHCVSSVYFYYKPEYSFLSLGTYSSLREIALTRELQKQSADLRFYYMGYYIHSCPKMRYKGRYNPSLLLCPESYSWTCIEKCVPKLDASKYSRLTEDGAATDADSEAFDVNEALISINKRLSKYRSIRSRVKEEHRESIDKMIEEYATYVGKTLAYRMSLILQ